MITIETERKDKKTLDNLPSAGVVAGECFQDADGDLYLRTHDGAWVVVRVYTGNRARVLTVGVVKDILPVVTAPLIRVDITIKVTER